MRCRRIVLIASALLIGLALSGCESFDPENALNIFNQKKPLPGDRKAMFPSGVPGVPQGVPPELVQGYQPPPEPPPQVAAAPVEKPKPKKTKPHPQTAAAPARPAKPRVAAQPAARPAPAAQSAQWPASQPATQPTAWPAPQPTQAAPGQSPFPDPPPAR